MRDFIPAYVGSGSKTAVPATTGLSPVYPRTADIGRRGWRVSFVPRPAVSRCSKRSYSITPSARTRKDSGTVSPSAFAVVRLTMRSNLMGCSTGRSAGFAPRKILST